VVCGLTVGWDGMGWGGDGLGWDGRGFCRRMWLSVDASVGTYDWVLAGNEGAFGGGAQGFAFVARKATWYTCWSWRSNLEFTLQASQCGVV